MMVNMAPVGLAITLMQQLQNVRHWNLHESLQNRTGLLRLESIGGANTSLSQGIKILLDQQDHSLKLAHSFDRRQIRAPRAKRGRKKAESCFCVIRGSISEPEACYRVFNYMWKDCNSPFWVAHWLAQFFWGLCFLSWPFLHFFLFV